MDLRKPFEWELSKKEIAFDLNTNKLKLYFKSYNKAYLELKNFFKMMNFHHRQGSVYCSNDIINNYKVLSIIDTLIKRFPWMLDCLTEMDVTNVGDLHRVTSYFK